MSKSQAIVERLVEQLDLAHALRASVTGDAVSAARRDALRKWQAERLASTYADLLASPRFGETAAFFLSDIYGRKDLSLREEHVRQILPVMTRVLPMAGLETVADAIELSALSERLDAAMIDVLGADSEHLDAAIYASAYRKAGDRAARERQIALIVQLAHSLDRLTRSPLIGMALSTMRKPAQLAGLGELQDFLERGYKAFRKMKGADEFIRIVTTRESELMEALFAGNDKPL
jgi:hypothetical protein